MWETDHAWNVKDRLRLLKEGWEPFAVTTDGNGGYVYHFRRFVKESK